MATADGYRDSDAAEGPAYTAPCYSIGAYVYAGVDAFQQTALNFTGQNFGAKKFDRIRRVLVLCIACVTVTELVLGGVTFLFSKQLFIKKYTTQQQ